MEQKFEVIELEIESVYYQALKKLAERENLSAEQYFSMIVDRYLENHTNPS